jgi:hypothetical protein
VFGSQLLSGRTEKPAAMNGGPGHVHRIGVALDQNGQVDRQLGELWMHHLTGPGEVQAAKVLHPSAAHVHVQERTSRTQRASSALRLSTVRAHPAEVADLSAAPCGRAHVAVQPARVRHEARAPQGRWS